MEDKTAAEIMTHPAISAKKTPPTEISRFNLYPSSKVECLSLKTMVTS